MARRSFVARTATVAAKTDIIPGTYQGMVIGIHVEDRVELKGSKYSSRGDKFEDFRLVIQIDVDGKKVIVANYPKQAKFFKGSKGAESNGFKLIKSVLGIVSDAKAQDVIDENTTDDGGFDYGVFIGQPVEVIYTANSNGKSVISEIYKADDDAFEPSPMDLPAWLFSNTNVDDVVYKYNMRAGYLEEFEDVEKNAELLDSLEATMVDEIPDLED